MGDVSLEEVLALNEELAALDAAGFPVDLGDSGQSTAEKLAAINASLILRTSLGQSVNQALADDDQLPTVYRYAVLTGLESQQMALALDGVSRQPFAWVDLRQTVGRAFLQPLILLALAYCGFIFLCLWYSPALEAVYAQVQEQPNLGLRILMFFREWLPVWGPVLPVLIGVGIYLCTSRGRAQRPRLAGSQGYLQTVANAIFAEQLASLLAAGVPFADSVRTAGNASGDSAIMRASEVVATHKRDEPLRAAEAEQLVAFLPRLRWALTGDLAGEPLPELLQLIAAMYRQKGERQSAAWRTALPTVVGALVGGVILLLFCLSMFGPYIGLLRDLAF